MRNGCLREYCALCLCYAVAGSTVGSVEVLWCFKDLKPNWTPGHMTSEVFLTKSIKKCFLSVLKSSLQLHQSTLLLILSPIEHVTHTCIVLLGFRG